MAKELLGVVGIMVSHHRALNYLYRALAKDEKALGPDHPTSAVTLTNIATVYGQKRMADAENNLREAIRFFERQRPFSRTWVIVRGRQTLDNLATTYNIFKAEIDVKFYKWLLLTIEPFICFRRWGPRLTKTS